MKKPKRRVQKNYALRNEMIGKSYITPVMLLPNRLKQRGYLEAAKAAGERIARGFPLYMR